MRTKERRRAMAELLQSATEPLSGSELSRRFDVSRQIVVQDVALLKEQGYEILSTNRGYLLQKSPLVERTFKVFHSSEETGEELSLIVSLGGTVADVFVWHKVYGKIRAPLHIFSERGIEQFLEGVRTGKSKELMHITGGYHYHTVRAESREILDRIGTALEKQGFLAPEFPAAPEAGEAEK